MYKMLIAVSTHNHSNITELSLAMLREVMGSADRLLVYDDSSTACDKKWLMRFADEVIRMPRQSSIERLRTRSFSDFVCLFKEFELLYTTTGEAVHDPGFSHRLRGLYGRHSADGVKLPVSLYNSPSHNYPENVIRREGEISFRKTAPSVSQMYDREMAQVIVNGLDLQSEPETGYAYDCDVSLRLGRPFLQSEVSFVEYFGGNRREGTHATSGELDKQNAIAYFERDRAINPSVYLKMIRPVVIEYILERMPETTAVAA